MTLQIDFKESSVPSKKFTAPCLLLNTNGTPTTLRVSSHRYYPLAIDIGKKASRNVGTTFFVKRRSGYLGHSEDPHSQRSLVVHTGTRSGSVRKLVEAFTEDPLMLAYSQYLCGEPSKRPLTWVPWFCTRVLHESLSSNTEEALPLYLKLRSSVEAMRDDFPASVEAVWDVRLIRTYYEARSRIVSDSTTRLLSAEFVSMMNELVEQGLSATPLDENDVLVYMKSGEARQTAFNDAAQLGLLGSFLTFYEVPFPRRNADTMVL